ncbi:hypothetical protein D3C72_627510 [compost metagenome]
MVEYVICLIALFATLTISFTFVAIKVSDNNYLKWYLKYPIIFPTVFGAIASLFFTIYYLKELTVNY